MIYTAYMHDWLKKVNFVHVATHTYVMYPVMRRLRVLLRVLQHYPTCM